jgi:hypothetical protein
MLLEKDNDDVDDPSLPFTAGSVAQSLDDTDNVGRKGVPVDRLRLLRLEAIELENESPGTRRIPKSRRGFNHRPAWLFTLTLPADSLLMVGMVVMVG